MKPTGPMPLKTNGWNLKITPLKRKIIWTKASFLGFGFRPYFQGRTGCLLKGVFFSSLSGGCWRQFEYHASVDMGMQVAPSSNRNRRVYTWGGPDQPHQAGQFTKVPNWIDMQTVRLGRLFFFSERYVSQIQTIEVRVGFLTWPEFSGSFGVNPRHHEESGFHQHGAEIQHDLQIPNILSKW